MRRFAAVSALLLAALVQDAGAQLKLPKIKNPLAQATPGGGSLRTGRVAFDGVVLEITQARLDQFGLGLAAEAEMGARVEGQDLDAIDRRNRAMERDYQRDRSNHERTRAAYQRCVQGEANATEAAPGGAIPSEADRARMEAVGKRIQAAQQAGNTAEAMRLTDSLVKAVTPVNQRVVSATAGLEARAVAKCGPPPAEPARPVLQPVLTYADVMQAGIRTSGFTESQYRVLRERIAPFVLSRGESSDMVYDPAEIPVLRAGLGALSRHLDVLKRY